MRLLTSVTFCLMLCTTLATHLTIYNSWSGGYKAKLCITSDSDADCGYEAEVEFFPNIDKLEIWDVDIKDTQHLPSSTKFTLINKSYLNTLSAGQDFCFEFVVRKSGKQLSESEISVNAAFTKHCTTSTVPPPPAGPSTYTIVNSWNGGFIGKLCVTSETAACGWQITMTFNPEIKKIQNLWDGQFVSMNGNTAIVDDAGYNSDLKAAETVCVGFNAAVYDNAKVTASTQTISAVFSYIGSCGAQDTPATTPEPITTTPEPITTTPEPITTTTAETTTTTANEITTAERRTTVETATTAGTIATTANTGTTEPPIPGQGRYDYNDVLHKSILFYEAQRSGDLPANNRIPWRGDSALGDSSPNGRDLTGGWYDAGDYVKFNLPMAFATSTLLWGLIRFEDGYRASGELENMYDSIRWPLDYFIKCWDSSDKVYWAQVGDGDSDHAYWGRPEDMTMDRPASGVSTSSGGSEVSAETAAALAAGSIAFKTKDPAYSAKLLEKAISLYEFAYNYRGTYTDSVPAIKFYRSYSGYNDELCWGAAWLYKATGNDAYIEAAHEFAFANQDEFSWDAKLRGCQVLLYEIAKEKGDTSNENTFRNYIESFVSSWMPGGNIPQTTCGLAWIRQWGPLRYAANTALIAMVAAEDGINPAAYRAWATKQINFMLGDNLNHRSYVVGFGTNPPVRPHHSSSSCPDVPAQCSWDDFNRAGPNPQTLYGALVGGPDQNEDYDDVRSDYISNEVACDYNSCFQSTLAGLRHLEATSQLPSVSPPAGCE